MAVASSPNISTKRGRYRLAHGKESAKRTATAPKTVPTAQRAPSATVSPVGKSSAALPTVETVVMVSYLERAGGTSSSAPSPFTGWSGRIAAWDECLAGDARLDQLDFRVRIDRGHRIARGFHLGLPYRRRAMHDLPLQVGEIHHVVVAQRDRADAR